MMAFLGHTQIIEVETIDLHQVGSKPKTTDNSRIEISARKEMHLMSDIMFALFAVFRML